MAAAATGRAASTVAGAALGAGLEGGGPMRLTAGGAAASAVGRAAAAGLDPDTARQLWQATAQLTGTGRG